MRDVAAAIAATDTTADRLRNSPDQAPSKPAASAALVIATVSSRPPARTVMPRVVICTACLVRPFRARISGRRTGDVAMSWSAAAGRRAAGQEDDRVAEAGIR